FFVQARRATAAELVAQWSARMLACDAVRPGVQQQVAEMVGADSFGLCRVAQAATPVVCGLGDAAQRRAGNSGLFRYCAGALCAAVPLAAAFMENQPAAVPVVAAIAVEYVACFHQCGKVTGEGSLLVVTRGQQQ